MSEIRGLGALLEKLEKLPATLVPLVEAALDEELARTQQDAANNVPVHTGRGRQTILSDDAISKRRAAGGKSISWRFGFLTKEMQRAAYYLFWVEFGTKGYCKGEQRVTGRDNKGRARLRKLKRSIPARPAQPWFRPAVISLRQRLQSSGLVARIVEGAGAKSGFRK